MQTYQIVLITIGALLGLRILALIVLSGGNTRRMALAIRAGWRLLRDEHFVGKVAPLLAPTQSPSAQPTSPSGVTLRFLALLQREGRLLDFLLEDVADYPDAQVGAAVRDIHRQCQASLKEHLVLAPVFTQMEGATVDVPAGFDPSAVRLVGNVTGQPPFRGTLRHHGWRVVELKLAEPPIGQDELVLMPAEVELT
jgi:hypothetical protein